MAQGTIGSGIELGLEAARLTFDPAFYGAENPAWLREEAALAVLFVSDEDDLSPLSVSGYQRAFADLKGDRGHREPGWVTLSAVVGDAVPTNPNAPSCVSDNGEGWYGERYLAAANGTGGITASICADDFAPIVAELGLTLSGLEARFGLSRNPQLDTMEVKLYAADSDDSFVRDLERDVDFTYDPGDNALLFAADQVPPSEHYVTVRYTVAPDAVEQTQ